MRLALNGVANGVVSACALTVLGLTLGRGMTQRTVVTESEQMVPEWTALAGAGQSVGPADAPAVLVTFSDFQCPFCARLADQVAEIRAEQPGRLRMVFRHLPLSMIHPHAHVAALAAECAAEQGRFESFHDALFARQDSIGSLSWAEFAERAGVPDGETFKSCVTEQRHVGRVNTDLQLAEALGLTGTPTLFLNGVQLREGMPPAELRRRVAEAARGR